MGTIKQLKCPACNYQWEHHEGFGLMAAFYYCDKCGKEKSINFRDDDKEVELSREYGKCQCGGTFRMDNDIILCPQCQTPAEEISGVSILWD